MNDAKVTATCIHLYFNFKMLCKAVRMSSVYACTRAHTVVLHPTCDCSLDKGLLSTLSRYFVRKLPEEYAHEAYTSALFATYCTLHALQSPIKRIGEGFTSEEQVFEFLGLEYIPPEYRNC
jgi:hypothetical protein